MGRKIPAKKHRGVKDPLVQQAKRVESLKGKINAPPRDPDEQPVPKSLLRLFGAPVVERREKRVRAVRKPRGYGPSTPNAISRLKILPGETGRAFSKRITSATRALHAAEDPHHYPQDEEEDIEERPARRKNRPDAEPRPTKAQRRKLKQQEKKEEVAKSRLADAASELVYERVSFGEQAHAPPSLPAPRLPRAVRDTAPSVPRPGRRDLLLTRLLPGGGGGVASAGRGAELKEQRRLDVVSAYRELKKQQRLAASR